MALKPLLENTPRSPRTDKSPTRIETPEDVRAYLEDVRDRATWFTCPECDVEWNNLTPEGVCISCMDERGRSSSRQAQLGEYLLKTIGRYGIERYSFNSFDVDHSNAYAVERFSRFNAKTDNLYLYGPTGIGKTHLAGALLKQCAANNLTIKWVNPMYLAMELTGRFAADQKSLIEDLASKDVVILDDLGLGDELKMTMKIIYMLTDRRTAAKKNGLVITSNLSIEDLAKNFRDDRIASRISGLCRVIKMDGKDRRVMR